MTRVDFPLPVGPTTANVLPGAISNEMSSSAGAAEPGYVNDTPSKRTDPSSVSPSSEEPSAREDSVSTTSVILE